MNIKLNYSIETLIHFICHCNNSWSQSIPTDFDHPIMPEKVICPKCGEQHQQAQFEDITKQWYFCSTHEVWYHTSECPMCDAVNEAKFTDG